MFSTIDKIFHYHHFISAECNYSIPSYNQEHSHNNLT